MCRFIKMFCLGDFQVNLRLILVSGKTQDFIFSPNDSAMDIAKHVFDNWPLGEFLRVGRWTRKLPLHGLVFFLLSCIAELILSLLLSDLVYWEYSCFLL